MCVAITSVFNTGARLSDSGAIKCIAINPLGRATSNAQLMVEGMLRHCAYFYSGYQDFIGSKKVCSSIETYPFVLLRY